MFIRCSRVRVAIAALVVSSAAGAAEVEVIKSLEWQSPLGVTVVRYHAEVDGMRVYEVSRTELWDEAGKLVYWQDGLASILDAAAGSSVTHPKPMMYQADDDNPLAASRREAGWVHEGGRLRPVVRETEIDLLKTEPLAVERFLDPATGSLLRERSLIREAAPQGFHVYAEADGRPMLSPFGDTWPHPTGQPDGWLPTAAASQSLFSQGVVLSALPDPWLDPAATATFGNNVHAFFNSTLDEEGIATDDFEELLTYRPEAGDFAANASSGSDFVYAYDPFDTHNEFFQYLYQPGEVPDSSDVALNAKIVQAFYITNWLHDFFYRAGFNEVAGNFQASNYGRGGLENDPLVIASGLGSTFAMLLPEGMSPVLALGLNTTSASQRDGSMDFPLAAHEWAHVLIHRLVELSWALQQNALHEGIADFVGLLVGVSHGDDFSGAFALGHYFNMDYVHPPYLPPGGVAPDAMYYGIRRYPYSTDMSRNPLTFENLVEPPTVPYFNCKGRGPNLHEPHTAGEILASALFECFANKASVAGSPAEFEERRLRMAQYLVAGLALFSETAGFLEARNALLAVMRATNEGDHAACRAGFAKRGMGAGALLSVSSDGTTYASVTPSELDRDQKLLILNAEARADVDCEDCASGVRAAELDIEIVNAGLMESEAELRIETSSGVTFPDGEVFAQKLLAQSTWTKTVPLRVSEEVLEEMDGQLELLIIATIPESDAGAGEQRQETLIYSMEDKGKGKGKGGGGALAALIGMLMTISALRTRA